MQRAIITAHEPVGRGYFRLLLDAPGIARMAEPGQFVMLRVSGTLDPFLARPLGIGAVQRKRYLTLYYRIAGKGTALLSTRERGEPLGLVGPVGNGFPAPRKGEMPILVAGGSGFPPLLFFSLRYGKRSPLLVGSRTKNLLPPVPVLREFRSAVSKLLCATDDGSQGTRGFVTDLVGRFLDKQGQRIQPVIYACGPRPMLAAVHALAAVRDISCYVSMEERMACGTGICMGCSVPLRSGGYSRVCREGPVFDSRVLAW